MKEFIEKLIGILKESLLEYINKANDEMIENGHTLDFENFLGHKEAYENVLYKIVNQLAEEYNQKHEPTIDLIEYGVDGYNHHLKEQYKKGYEDAKSESGWIPCSERLPEVENKVLIFAKRKYRDGGFKNIITTAMYEDGTVLENDSKWRWEDIEGEWDEENDCYVIPEGWWEDKMYNADDADGELNHAIDDEVIAWQPLPEPYQLKGA